MNVSIIRFAKKYLIWKVQDCPPKKAALVLGARVYENGRLCPILEDRVKVGIELYKSGKVEKILFSGDHGSPHYDEVNAMKNYAQAEEVAVDDIFLDHAGFCTYDSLYRAKEVFGLQSLLVVTQQFHLDRSIYIGRKLGIEVIGIPADKRIYYGHKINSLRELLARSKAFINIHFFHPKPKFPNSPKINIAGSGSQTHDKTVLF